MKAKELDFELLPDGKPVKTVSGMFVYVFPLQYAIYDCACDNAKSLTPIENDHTNETRSQPTSLEG